MFGNKEALAEKLAEDDAASPEAMGADDYEDMPDEEMGMEESDEPSEGEIAAAEEAIAAMKAGDAKGFAKALDAHYTLCMARKAE